MWTRALVLLGSPVLLWVSLAALASCSAPEAAAEPSHTSGHRPTGVEGLSEDQLRWLPTITGQILDPEGRPAVDAVVVLEGWATGPDVRFDENPPRTRVTRTDASGWYRFDHVVPFEKRFLSALGEFGCYRHVGLSEIGWIGERRRAADVQLDPVSLLEGVEVVVELEDEGEPVVGLELALQLRYFPFTDEARKELPGSPRTDERGRARVWVPHTAFESGSHRLAGRFEFEGRQGWAPLFGSRSPSEAGTEESPIVFGPMPFEKELRPYFPEPSELQPFELRLLDENEAPLRHERVRVETTPDARGVQHVGSMITDGEGRLRFEADFANADSMSIYRFLGPDLLGSGREWVRGESIVSFTKEELDLGLVTLEISRFQQVIEVVDQLGRPVEGAVVVGQAKNAVRVTDASGRVDWPFGADSVHVCHRDRGSLVDRLTSSTWRFGFDPADDVARVRIGERYALRLEPMRDGLPVRFDAESVYDLVWTLHIGLGPGFDNDAAARSSAYIESDGTVLVEWSTGLLLDQGDLMNLALGQARVPVLPGSSWVRFPDLPGGQVVIDLIKDAGRIPTEPLRVMLPEEDR